MSLTKYTTYSTEELLLLVQDRRYLSPIIEELCQRLERFDSTCPVCEAELFDAFEEKDS